jgi:hypothetical protein
MNPLLYPLALILYAEGSYSKITKTCSRSLLYTYLLNLLITSYVLDTNTAVILCILTHLIAYSYCISLCDSVLSKSLFFLMLIITTFIYITIIKGDIVLDISFLGESLLQHSNYIYREGNLLAISLCSLLLANHSQRVHSRENFIGVSLIAALLVERL